MIFELTEKNERILGGRARQVEIAASAMDERHGKSIFVPGVER